MFVSEEYQNLIEPSVYTDNHFHTEFLSLLIKEDITHIHRLKEIIFTLILPDAIIGGKFERIISFYGEHGFRPIFLKLCQNSSEAHAENLYAYNLVRTHKANMVGTWWLNRQTFDLGPVVAVVLYRPNNDVHSIHQAFMKIKGPSSPYRARFGEVRFELEAVNTAMSLVHASDDPLSTAREFLVYFTLRELKTVLSRVEGVRTRTIAEDVDATIRDQQLDIGRALSGFHSETDFLRTLVGVVWRLFLRVQDYVSFSKKVRFHAAILNVHRIAYGHGNIHDRTRRFFMVAETIDYTIQTELEGVTVAELLGAIKNALGWKAYTYETAVHVIEIARKYRVRMTRLEEIVLKTSMHFRDDFVFLLAER